MRATAIKGLAVRPDESDQSTGTVNDLVLDLGERRILALLLARQGDETVYALDVGDIAAVAEDRIMVRPGASPLPLEDLAKYAGMPTLGRMLEEKAMTESGDVLGKLADVEIDIRSWRVTGYEIVRSNAEALQRDEHELSPEDVVSAGAHMLLVSDSAMER